MVIHKDNTIITMLTMSTEKEHFYMSDLPDTFSNFTDQHLYLCIMWTNSWHIQWNYEFLQILRVKIKRPWDKIRFQISRHPLTKIIIMQKQLQLCKFILDSGVENGTLHKISKSVSQEFWAENYDLHQIAHPKRICQKKYFVQIKKHPPH